LEGWNALQPVAQGVGRSRRVARPESEDDCRLPDLLVRFCLARPAQDDLANILATRAELCGAQLHDLRLQMLECRGRLPLARKQEGFHFYFMTCSEDCCRRLQAAVSEYIQLGRSLGLNT
jgi:hypothetical protein